MDASTPAVNMATLIGRLLVKTFYGHTMGEVLTLSVALERAVDEVVACQLGASLWAQEEIADQILGHVPRQQKAKIAEGIFRHLGHPDEDVTVSAIEGVYRLRDRLAHSSLVDEGFDDRGWTLATRRRGVERSHQIPVDEVDKIMEAGREALVQLLELLERSGHGDDD